VKTQTVKTQTVKTHILSIACFVAAIATSQASAVIYDNFTGTAGPLASSPSASLWTTLSGDTAALDGSGNLVQTGAGASSEITSTTVFNIIADIKFQFKLADIGSFYGGVAMLFDSSAHGLYIRNDIAGFQLWAYDGAGGHSASTFTPVQGALWELSYDSSTQKASAFQNGSLVGSLTGIDFGGDTTAQFRSFQYGGAGVQTKFDYVAVATVPEPSTTLLLGFAIAPVLMSRRRARA
jgi:hypothetical protein